MLSKIKKLFNISILRSSRAIIFAVGCLAITSVTVYSMASGYNFHQLEQKAIALAAAEAEMLAIAKANEPVVVTEQVEVEIPFTETRKANTNLTSGEERIAQKGVNGTRLETYQVIYVAGVVQEKTLIGKETIKNPVAQVVEIGNSGMTLASRGDETRYSQVYTMTATGYDAKCLKCTGDLSGITATGIVGKKGIVAVDPKVIPLGSKVYVETEDGSYIYGTAIAADTGGAIKGMKIDLCFNSHQEALNFGRRTVKVYVE